MMLSLTTKNSDDADLVIVTVGIGDAYHNEF